MTLLLQVRGEEEGGVEQHLPTVHTDPGTLLLHAVTLLVQCCNTVTLLLHCCHANTVVTLFLRCYYTVVTLLLQGEIQEAKEARNREHKVRSRRFIILYLLYYPF
jgi:hypothetical protein